MVLQDLGLPPDGDGVTEGFETLKETLALAPHTKVIVVTGKPTAQRPQGRALRRAGLLPEPVDVDVLKLIVDRAFRMPRSRKKTAA